MRVWAAESGALLRTLEGHAAIVTSVAYSPDGSRIVSGSGDNTARVWDAGSGKKIRTIKSQALHIYDVAIHDGRVAIAGKGGGIQAFRRGGG